MKEYQSMTKQELQEEYQAVLAQYRDYQAKGLKLDMSRGKPCTEQLELSNGLLSQNQYIGENGEDSRNYGLLPGMPQARRFFAELLGVEENEVIVGGNSSLTLMYYMIDMGWRVGFADSDHPWRTEEKLKFLCPVPGYDRHFAITEYFGFEMIPVPMHEDGPDMDLVEQLAADPSVKGIWCVPLYSNPDGYIYSAETVRRLASMKTGAPDFKIIWDDAYCVHHLTDELCSVPGILAECKKYGTQDRPLLVCSTSKVTFPGAGVAALAASEANIRHILAQMAPMAISFDKMNQMRHVSFLKNKAGVLEHMKKHRAILEPKFELIKKAFAQQLSPCGSIARWTDPKGGYFISLYVMDGCAKRVVQLCKEAGVVLTPAGSAYPYGNDPQDHHLRIAPSYPTVAELEQASQLLCVSVRLACLEKLLQA